jgi:hypothetical protein
MSAFKSAVHKSQVIDVFKSMIMKEEPKIELNTESVLRKKNFEVNLVKPEFNPKSAESELIPYYPEMYEIAINKF